MRSERKNISIYVDYKKQLDRAADKVGIEVDERIKSTEVLYTLVDHFLEDAIKLMVKQRS
jgi:hypothetical protein